MTKEQIANYLKTDTAEITFTKVDGTERTLNCTLQESFIPKREIVEDSTKTPKADNPNVLSVWDIDNAGWRSFRIDSIKEIYSNHNLVTF
jgi:hypothetical protein